MKPLKQFIQEKLVIKKNKTRDYKYFPETKEELRDIIERRIKKEGKEADLNDIDTSKITDMSNLFNGIDFNGDISSWNVSKVIDMDSMFYGCKSFNQDISNWDVSNVNKMSGMFTGCESFKKDISNWNVSNVISMRIMFDKCPIKEKYTPKFK